MAYTKAPAAQNHDVKRIPALGSPYVTTDITHSPASLFYSNCFPLKEGQWGTDPLHAVHKREGYTTTDCIGSVVGTGAMGACTVQSYGTQLAFFAKGTTVYSFNYTTNTITALDVKGNYGYGFGTSFIDSTNARRIAWLEASGGGTTYLFSCDESAGTITTTNLAAITAEGNAGLVFIDGYLFAANANGTRIYNSDPAGAYTVWNTQNFIDAEQYADRIGFIAKHHNYLVALGQSSVEFFYNNSVEVGSPLARQESYATRIGLYRSSSLSGGGSLAVNIEDDIYFLGKTEQDNVSLYRIKDFKVEEMDSQYMQNVFNDPNLEYYGLSVSVINNNPCVIVNFRYNLPFAFLVREQAWWEVSGSDFAYFDTRLGQPFVPIFTTLGIAKPCYTLGQTTAGGTSVLKYEPDFSYVTSVAAQYTTETIDFGVNRQKHLARIDAIGDYGDNDITLGINPTPNYFETFVTMDPASQNAATNTYEQPMSWYNCGSPRRFIARIGMEGTYPSIHRALEIEYNIGMQ